MSESVTEKASGGGMLAWWKRLPAERRRRLIVLNVAIFLFIFPLIDRNGGDLDAAANATAFAVLALGLNIVVGFAGLLDLGYAAFFAIGAYTYGILSSWQVQPQWWGFWDPFQWLGLVERFHADGVPDVVHFTFSFWLSMPICAVVAAFFGVLFGAPTLRLRGDYLAIVTLGFGEIVPIVARNTPYLTNGAIGLNGAAPPKLFGYNFGVESEPFYYLGLLMIIFLIFVSLRLQNSRVGRAWIAIREDETAAAAMGVPLMRTKTWAYAIGAAFGGMAGAYYASFKSGAFPSDFYFNISVFLLCMVILGGLGSVWGVVLGGIILSWLNVEGLAVIGRKFNDAAGTNFEIAKYQFGIYGTIIVLMMLFRPTGLIPERRRKREHEEGVHDEPLYGTTH